MTSVVWLYNSTVHVRSEVFITEHSHFPVCISSAWKHNRIFKRKKTNIFKRLTVDKMSLRLRLIFLFFTWITCSVHWPSGDSLRFKRHITPCCKEYLWPCSLCRDLRSMAKHQRDWCEEHQEWSQPFIYIMLTAAYISLYMHTCTSWSSTDTSTAQNSIHWNKSKTSLFTVTGAHGFISSLELGTPSGSQGYSMYFTLELRSLRRYIASWEIIVELMSEYIQTIIVLNFNTRISYSMVYWR